MDNWLELPVCKETCEKMISQVECEVEGRTTVKGAGGQTEGASGLRKSYQRSS